MARRRGRVSAREQRLGEVQPRVAAAVLGAGLEQFVEIIQLGRSRGAGERLVQIGIAQVNHAEHELCLRPALGVGSSERVFEQACSLLVAALLVELHRRTHRVVGAAYGRAHAQRHRERHHEQRREQRGERQANTGKTARHGVSP